MNDVIIWDNTKFKDINEQDRPESDDIFICVNGAFDDLFNEWEYVVGIGRLGKRAKPLGLFKDIKHAKIFAENIQ